MKEESHVPQTIPLFLPEEVALLLYDETVLPYAVLHPQLPGERGHLYLLGESDLAGVDQGVDPEIGTILGINQRRSDKHAPYVIVFTFHAHAPI